VVKFTGTRSNDDDFDALANVVSDDVRADGNADFDIYSYDFRFNTMAFCRLRYRKNSEKTLLEMKTHITNQWT
jgi:hypothetical protein